MIFCFFLISVIYLPFKIIMSFIVNKYGKLSYDGFSAAGFAYDSEKNIFYSTKNAWQKKFGYCHLYDISAPFFHIFIDTEPVKFYYNNKNWLITFWKGQYGITTGAEIGVYSTNQQNTNKKTLYFPVKDSEMLNMSFVLYKNDIKITSVESRHWWLAIFKIGLFSKPKELSMDIKITFPNEEMLNAFLASFKKLKHKKEEYKIEKNTFYFNFKKPKTHKVWTRFLLSNIIRQKINRKNVILYDKYLSDVISNSKDDEKQIKLSKWIPEILRNKSNEEIFLKNNEDNNVIFLNKDVFSNFKKDNL